MEILSAYDGPEGIEILSREPDIAVVFLDVVMETDDAGLRAVRRIREELGNLAVRIILRTGQPGQAPEREVIEAYDINDYKAKSELTADKLMTATATALRSYAHIRALDTSRVGLEKIINASAAMMQERKVTEFAEGVLIQLRSLMPAAAGLMLCTERLTGGAFHVAASAGSFAGLIGKPLADAIEPEAYLSVYRAVAEGRSHRFGDLMVVASKGRRNAASVIYVGQTSRLTPIDDHLIEIFCNNVVIAYDNIHLYGQLIQAQRATVHALGKLAEYKDENTGDHVRRVERMVDLIAMEMFSRGLYPEDLDEETLSLIGLASILHDVGKVAVPDAILRKPGKLDPDEYKVMVEHASIGGNILREAAAMVQGRSYLSLGADIAETHHEKMDGTGYPKGLKGQDIPVIGRITAVADVYDALMHARPYKPAWPLDKTLDYILQQTGPQFDPVVVDAFLAVLKRQGLTVPERAGAAA